MNAHDSERISGLLEEAGYVAAAGDAPDLIVFNTCAVRENADNRLYGNLGHLRPVKDAHPGHADRRRRMPGPEGPGRRWSSGRRGSTSCSARTTSASLPALLERARHNAEAQVEIARGARGLPERAAGAARFGGQRLGEHQRRLRQHLHLLHRAEPSRRASVTAAPATCSPRCRRSSSRASWRSRCSARTSTPTAAASAIPARSPRCCVPWAGSTGSSGCGSPRRIRATSPTT